MYTIVRNYLTYSFLRHNLVIMQFIQAYKKIPRRTDGLA